MPKNISAMGKTATSMAMIVMATNPEVRVFQRDF